LSQADSQQFVAIPEPENDTPNPSKIAALAQDCPEIFCCF